MIAQENQQKFEALISQIKDLFPDTTTFVKIEINAENTKVASKYRYPDQLKKSGVSMRNIKGDFIKDIKQ